MAVPGKGHESIGEDKQNDGVKSAHKKIIFLKNNLILNGRNIFYENVLKYQAGIAEHTVCIGLQKQAVFRRFKRVSAFFIPFVL